VSAFPTGKDIAHLLGVETGIASSISWAFDCMGVAEKEIARAKRAHPKRADAIHGAFRILYPGMLSEFRNERLYRHHVQELLDRVARDEDLKPGTTAECLASLSKTSLVAPLRADPTNLAYRLFQQVLGRSIAGETIRESFPGALDELEQDMRRKLSSERDPA
jgi:hypothetical protein